ncbi:MAG: hypothetical protein ACRCV0_06970, partial [Brevinema sp.]
DEELESIYSNPSELYLLYDKVFKNNDMNYEKFLKKTMESNIITPSYHLLGTAFDLSPITDTVTKIYELKTGSKRMTTTGNKHLHLGF